MCVNVETTTGVDSEYDSRPYAPDEAPSHRLGRRLWGTPIFILSVSDGTTPRVLFTKESYATLGTALWGPSLPVLIPTHTSLCSTTLRV
jgi:hypothetical protein